MLPFLTYFTSKIWPPFWPLKVIQCQIWRCQSIAHGYFQESPTWVQPRVCHRFRDISCQMIVALTFNTARASKVKSMGRVYNVRWVPHLNCCRSSHISRQKIWRGFFGPEGHTRSNVMVPIESQWVLHVSVSGSPTSHLSPFSTYSSQSILILTFNLSRSSKVKPMGHTS